MLTAFKILTMLWPFVKEMFFGKKTLSEILRDNKMRAVVLLFITTSLLFNIFTVSKIIVISTEYIDLNKKYKELESSKQYPTTHGTGDHQLVEKPKLPTPIDVLPSILATKADTPLVVKKVKSLQMKNTRLEEEQRYIRLQQRFDAIRHLEEQSPRDASN